MLDRVASIRRQHRRCNPVAPRAQPRRISGRGRAAARGARVAGLARAGSALGRGGL